MKLIATQITQRFLVELTEDEATDVEMANEDIGDEPLEIVRAEGRGMTPRVWIDGMAELESLIDLLDADAAIVDQARTPTQTKVRCRPACGAPTHLVDDPFDAASG